MHVEALHRAPRKRIDLGGPQLHTYTQPLEGEWKLRTTKGGDWIPASVPGSVHLDLMAAGIIPDPFNECNQELVQWVHETDWVYRKRFQLDPRIPECDRVYLECEGLDTLATISVNGRRIATTDNMFIAHRIDVTDYIRNGPNTLEIKFKSPVRHVKPLLKNPGPVYWLDDAVPGSPFVRKAPCQWGWDWGPKLLPCGIWRPIKICGYRGGHIDDLSIAQRHDKEGKVDINISARVERCGKEKMTAVATLLGPDGRVLAERKANAARGRFAFEPIRVENPQLWWPNSYGNQPLYEVTVSLLVNNQVEQTLKRKIGLRTLKLEQKRDKWGRSFTFVVNGARIFCKGANWIPADSFPTRITDKSYEDLVMSSVQANMNMLRVWGGGFYEDERFYDLCDKHGILIWHDFMFSGGCHYPMDETFLANVSREVQHVVRRLRHRPSLALWCGNNEMEWYLWAGWIGGDNQQRKRDHTRLFAELIREIVMQEDAGRPYLRSSPSSCIEYKTPNSEAEGNGHYWEVWHSKLPYKAYREKCFRFVTEFGVCALPHIDTIAQFARPKDWNLTGPILESHQKCDAGNSLIAYYVAQDFRQPKDLPSMAYLSQAVQAEAIRCAVEHWRRNRNRCMGIIYWQLNDCWPAISWSSIDYNHRWKALHYAAKRFYAPVLISALDDGDRVELHITNDTRASFTGTIRWSLEDFFGTHAASGEMSVIAPAESDTLAGGLDLARQLAGADRRKKVLVYELLGPCGRVGGGVLSFVPTKLMELPEPELHMEVKQSRGLIVIELTAHNLARFVCVDLPGENFRLSDNFVDIPAGRTIALTVLSDHNDITRLRRDLIVRTIQDSY